MLLCSFLVVLRGRSECRLPIRVHLVGHFSELDYLSPGTLLLRRSILLRYACDFIELELRRLARVLLDLLGNLVLLPDDFVLNFFSSICNRV